MKNSRCRVSTCHRFVNSFVLTHVSPTGPTHRIQTSGIKQEDAYPKGSTFGHSLHMEKSRTLWHINTIWSHIPRVALLSILCKWRKLESYDTSMQYEVSVGVTNDGWLKRLRKCNGVRRLRTSCSVFKEWIHKTHNKNVASINVL